MIYQKNFYYVYYSYEEWGRAAKEKIIPAPDKKEQKNQKEK
jgi:hypothetical protein